MAFNMDDYEPVEARIARLYEADPHARITTDLIAYGDGSYIVKAYVYRANETEPWATGYAQESVTQRGVNSTSALENCETSAVGRALANAGFATKGKRPSREEMAKANREVAKPHATDEQIAGMVVAIAKAEDMAALNKVAHDLAQYDLGEARAALVAEFQSRKEALNG